MRGFLCLIITVPIGSADLDRVAVARKPRESLVADPGRAQACPDLGDDIGAGVVSICPDGRP